jgi:hypothetical protein
MESAASGHFCLSDFLYSALAPAGSGRNAVYGSKYSRQVTLIGKTAGNGHVDEPHLPEQHLFDKEQADIHRLLKRRHHGIRKMPDQGIDLSRFRHKAAHRSAAAVIGKLVEDPAADVEADIVERRTMLALPFAAKMGDGDRSHRTASFINQLSATCWSFPRPQGFPPASAGHGRLKWQANWKSWSASLPKTSALAPACDQRRNDQPHARRLGEGQPGYPARRKKGRIEKGQFADLIVPDKDFFACAEDEISFLTSDLTLVGGKIVYGAGDFAKLDESDVPPAMPDWSPVRTFGGYGTWGEPEGAGSARCAGPRSPPAAAPTTATSTATTTHAPGCRPPITDLKGFFGALGCTFWAV